MIDFNEKDFQLSTIRKESKLFNLQTKNAFRIYGLRTKGNPLIHLSYNYDIVDDDFDGNLEILAKFFQNNNIQFVWESGGGNQNICIGLRRDIKDHTILCSSIIQTIVYALEGRLDLKPDFKIKGVPSFLSNKSLTNKNSLII